MPSTWVDFRELRERLDFAEVLRHYGVELKLKRKDQHQGFCPLPTHNGQRRSPSFAANLTRKCWQCFGCGASGNVIDFAVRMSGHDPGDREAVRKIALELQERFLGSAEPTRDVPPKARQKVGKAVSENHDEGDEGAQQKPSEGLARPVIVNAPLDFTLKALDVEHPYLKQRGFTQETISHFGLGYCSRGLMQGRIVIPLHDTQRRLIGYAGRIVDDAKIGEDCPKYLFPSSREREGKVYEFRKSLLLYNLERIARPVEELAVVEGFASVWHCWQNGVAQVVSLMGASCSAEQAKLIVDWVSPSGRVWVMPDADEAGERCAASVLSQVAPFRDCRWAKLDSGQPTDLSADALSALLEREVAA
jgi:DNA primase